LFLTELQFKEELLAKREALDMAAAAVAPQVRMTAVEATETLAMGQTPEKVDRAIQVVAQAD